MRRTYSGWNVSVCRAVHRPPAATWGGSLLAALGLLTWTGATHCPASTQMKPGLASAPRSPMAATQGTRPGGGEEHPAGSRAPLHRHLPLPGVQVDSVRPPGQDHLLPVLLQGGSALHRLVHVLQARQAQDGGLGDGGDPEEGEGEGPPEAVT